jgi:hypothetical protein
MTNGLFPRGWAVFASVETPGVVANEATIAVSDGFLLVKRLDSIV